MTDRSKTHTPDRRLADIVREVKIAAADRDDVVVDIRDADLARLELLAEELGPLFADIDPQDDRFDFGISSGPEPRLWIDAVAHVHMGRDRRVFRFVRDTRLGRVVLGETSDLRQTADSVGRYIAERIIERERALAGDYEVFKARTGKAGIDARSLVEQEMDPDKRVVPVGNAASAPGLEKKTGPSSGVSRPTVSSDLQSPRRPSRGAGFVAGASWFILGCVAGAAALVAAFWDRISALFN